MVRDRRRLRRSVTVGVGIALMIGVDVAVLRTDASAKTGYQVVNGTVNAGADYVVYFNGAFSNFTPGVVDSLFPMSHSHIDNAPFAQSISSPADTGNAGETAVGAWNGNVPSGTPTLAQPQYAESRYPPQGKGASVGQAGGPYATATAGPSSATASATAANTLSQQSSSSASSTASGATTTTTGSGPVGSPAGSAVAVPMPAPAPAPAPAAAPRAVPAPAPAPASDARSARIAAFNTAIAAWRARYMTPDAAASHPMSAASASTPDGTDGDTSSSSVILDPDKGLISAGDARVAHASFGSGAIVLNALHIAVTITNAGTPAKDVALNIGDVSVGGVPVAAGSGGITVGPGVVPLDVVQQASAALNGILNAAGVTVVANAPVDKKSTAQETITASALSVVVDETGLPGAGEQTVQHSLGNVFADDLALPVPVTVSAPTGGAAGLVTTQVSSATPATTTPVQSTYIPGTAGTPGTPGSPGGLGSTSSAPPHSGAAPTTAAGPVATVPAVAAGAKVKPTWLLLFYLAWQALLVGAGASVWWWRSASKRTAAAVGA